jgi:hypothetical protein
VFIGGCLDGGWSVTEMVKEEFLQPGARVVISRQGEAVYSK